MIHFSRFHKAVLCTVAGALLITTATFVALYGSRLRNRPDGDLHMVSIRPITGPADIPSSRGLTYNSGINAIPGDNFSEFVIWNESTTTNVYGLEVWPENESFSSDVEALHFRGENNPYSQTVNVGSASCLVVTLPPGYLALMPFVVTVLHTPQRGGVYDHYWHVEVRTGPDTKCNMSTAHLGTVGNTRLWRPPNLRQPLDLHIIIGRFKS